MDAAGRRHVVITQHAVDWEDPSFGVLTRLTELVTDPEARAAPEWLLRFLLKSPEDFGTLYVNPMFTVEARAAIPEFFREARRAQVTWLKAFKVAVCATSSNLRRDLREHRNKDPLLCQLVFTGVMIADGKHLRPDQWIQNIRAPPNTVTLVGKTFTRLAVLERLPKGKWRCRCECGREHIVDGRHLRSGRTKSCGCFKKEVDQRRQHRKANRAWSFSGILHLRKK